MTIVVIATLLAISLRLHGKHKQRNKLLQQFKRLGASYKIRFSSYEVLHTTVIGLDDEQGKLLAVKKRTGATAVSRLIDLADIKTCLLEKQYGVPRAAGKKQGRLEQRLEKIFLHVMFYEGDPLKITFYNHLVDPVMELTSLAGKAKHWEVMLSRVQEPERKIA